MAETTMAEQSERLWTYITRCHTCGRECNRAEHVPDHARTKVVMSAPLVARCPVDEHNTGSDFNLHYDAEWVCETPEPAPAVKEVG